ncbi:response regulator transcription factor [Parageobacillus thermoglucosidasius]|uniref:response regulator transcription factor n=1 Tax=Parageobacillus thermoglucosidasius TaxID=1426 RepID=UPI000B5657EC|nr:response regulator transcription factor [Parageobacillus thermoglucosidasius]MBY6268419.1 DNA-binding response regulator [Parageobacillus thermoglucosidasius]MED4906416.1 response regulator transcription factor [Parageobacillus thermoglucosidasius]MED4915323.1 response regulator transcription factor [Parageobacillus thermoglucosidasius]MED4943956.1 response regulator transcription factor [Parageobacillus thermoglucosidasius]MED4982857.1 response regulator transcription factor [Parageobacill
MFNILLVEDQALVRQGLKMMIEQDPQLKVVAEAENGLEALHEMEQHIIDLVIMDIRMPVMNGLEATRKIKERWPDVKILILTTFNDDEYAVQALKDGANGFLLKTAEQQKLIQAIYSCMKGGMTIHEDVAAKMVPKLLQKSKQVHVDIPLSPRELMIAKLVGEGKTNKEIAAELHLSIGTVKNHITQILQKLQLRDRTQLAIYAIKHDITP